MDYNIDDLAYPHHVIQLADLFYERVEKDVDVRKSMNGVACLSIMNYLAVSHRKFGIDYPIYSVVGADLKPIVVASINANNNLAPSSKEVKEIQRRLSIALESSDMNQTAKLNISLVAKHSLILELMTYHLFNKDIHIITDDLAEEVEKKSNDAELSSLVQFYLVPAKDTVLRDPYKEPDMEGIFLIKYLKLIETGQIDNEYMNAFRVRLLKYVRKVSALADLLSSYTSDNHISPSTLSKIYYSALILKLLDYETSGSLSKGELEKYLDMVGGSSFIEEDIKKAVRNVLTFEIDFNKLKFKRPIHKVLVIFYISIGVFLGLFVYGTFSGNLDNLYLSSFIITIAGFIIYLALALYVQLGRKYQN
jgi:hypothetical protein